MSSSYAPSDYDATESRPDKTLVVKCNYEGATKRITFSSSRACTYDLLKHRVEQCFPLSATSYAITYTDDDGETTDITSEADLTEAIRYFYPGGDDPPLSSAASILSGRSFGRSKITLRVKISIDYDGPSLSDTSSLASMDDYKDRNGSEFSFSLSSPMSGQSSGEVEDDSITVSSKDMGSRYDLYRSAKSGAKTIVSGPSREPLVRRPLPRPPTSTSAPQNDWDAETVSSLPQSLSISSLSATDYGKETRVGDVEHGVFESLRLQETNGDASPSTVHGTTPLQSERGAAWLRDQSARTIKLMLGDLPAPSESDEQSVKLEESASMSGELALQKDPRGKFYYAYTSSGPSAPPSVDSGYEDTSSVSYEADGSLADSADIAERRPTSMEISWIESQAALKEKQAELPRPSSSTSHANQRSYSEPMLTRDEISPDIPAELLPFITTPTTPPKDPTTCSQCHAPLETFRYVCSTCGEKEPASRQVINDNNGLPVDDKGKGKAVYSDYASSNSPSFAYPPSPRPPPSSSPSVSSWTLVADTENPFHDNNAVNLNYKPLPALPSPPASSSPSSLTVRAGANGSLSPRETGFELCPNCIEHYGVLHALESSVAPSPQTDWPPSPEDAQRALSQWKRTASRKGQLRHAYFEKVWGPRGWDDVEQDDRHTCKCSTCNTIIVNMRYKCMSCKDFNLCKACYSQVHEIHPSHVFLVVPDKPVRTRSEPLLDVPGLMPDETGELSMTHLGVKCFHCLLDIIGARFHCAVCPSVDICSNCESAGLPGNLDSLDDGHNSSHIMIKIPYPLPSEELQSASRRAQQMWGHDAAAVEGESFNRSRRTSLHSAYARTVIGASASSLDVYATSGSADAHGVRCKRCNRPIVGVRYQCAHCPSKPEPYSLCAQCEPHSYAVHDPMHVFFKLPRPVDIPLESDGPFLPTLYRAPAGPPGGAYYREQPKAYLTDLIHSSAVCDRCMNRITGEWFRCVYCSKDLCDNCEGVDTHDYTHFFMVFKSIVDMSIFRQFAQLDRQDHPSPPVVQYPVYRQ